MRAVFDERAVDRLSSSDLCAGLNALEESPWGGWREGKGIDPRTLSRRLREYDVIVGTHRLPGGERLKGYRAESFADAWARYCPESGPVTAGGQSQPCHRDNPHGDWDPGVTDDPSAEPIRDAENPHGNEDVTVSRTKGRISRDGHILSDEDIAENEA